MTRGCDHGGMTWGGGVCDQGGDQGVCVTKGGDQGVFVTRGCL